LNPGPPSEQPPDPRSELIQKFRDAILKRRISEVSKTPDAESAAEKLDLEAEKIKAEIGGTVQDIQERKKYAHRSFCLVAVWLSAIGVVILLQGFKCSWR
jgi:hypothetical protein